MKPILGCCGGGVNTVGMLVGFHERGIKPARNLFADTGCEKPETYETITDLSDWCVSVGMPPVETVRANSVDVTLEAACLKNRVLPSVAYGFKTCSQRWKLEPQDKSMRVWLKERNIDSYVKAIGIDAGEPHRAKAYQDSNSETWFPLIEWGWRREECVAAILRAGLRVPHKSACFFCPSSKKSEVLWLKSKHPDLYWRAVSMERNAAQGLTAVKGLGRHWSWEELGKADESQFKMFTETVDVPCMCFDGDGEEDEAA